VVQLGSDFLSVNLSTSSWKATFEYSAVGSITVTNASDMTLLVRLFATREPDNIDIGIDGVDQRPLGDRRQHPRERREPHDARSVHRARVPRPAQHGALRIAANRPTDRAELESEIVKITGRPP